MGIRRANLFRAGGPGRPVPREPPRWVFQVAAAVLLLAAVGLGVLAFTRFGGDAVPPPSGSPGFAEYERERIREARVSVAFGVASAFALLGTFACLDRGRRARPVGLPGRPQR